MLGAKHNMAGPFNTRLANVDPMGKRLCTSRRREGEGEGAIRTWPRAAAAFSSWEARSTTLARSSVVLWETSACSCSACRG